MYNEYTFSQFRHIHVQETVTRELKCFSYMIGSGTIRA